MRLLAVKCIFLEMQKHAEISSTWVLSRAKCKSRGVGVNLKKYFIKILCCYVRQEVSQHKELTCC